MGNALLPSYDAVFVSPLNRALATVDKIIELHHTKVGAVLVLPILTEVLSKICDFSLPIE